MATKFWKINLKLISSLNEIGQGCFFAYLSWKYILFIYCFKSTHRIIHIGLRNFGVILVCIWVIYMSFVSQSFSPQFDILKLLMYLYYKGVELLLLFKNVYCFMSGERRNMEVYLIRGVLHLCFLQCLFAVLHLKWQVKHQCIWEAIATWMQKDVSCCGNALIQTLKILNNVTKLFLSFSFPGCGTYWEGFPYSCLFAWNGALPSDDWYDVASSISENVWSM